MGTIERYCDFFMGDRQGVASTPDEFYDSITRMEYSS